MASLLTLIPLSVSLSADAFAASLARGGRQRKAQILPALKSGAVFGIAEGVMCLTGWMLAYSFAVQVRAVDHWIALVLLAIIGGKMVLEGFEADKEDDVPEPQRGGLMGTVVTAIGTSIDSAAVGVALAVSGMSAFSALAIGSASFVASTTGFYIGPMVGERFGKLAEILGGIVLIGIGVSIFVSHSFFGG